MWELRVRETCRFKASFVVFRCAQAGLATRSIVRVFTSAFLVECMPDCRSENRSPPGEIGFEAYISVVLKTNIAFGVENDEKTVRLFTCLAEFSSLRRFVCDGDFGLVCDGDFGLVCIITFDGVAFCGGIFVFGLGNGEMISSSSNVSSTSSSSSSITSGPFPSFVSGFSSFLLSFMV